MEVGAIPGINGISGSQGANKEMSEEVFLQLLATQLQNQDPLEPAKDVEFIEQLATFAQLEQQRLINSNLGVIQLYDSSINNSNALNIVGKDVKIHDNTLSHTEGGQHTFYYESDSEAAKVHITIIDEDGNEVFTQTQLGAEDGEQPFTWYGVDNAGNRVPDGDYKIRVTLEDHEGSKFNSSILQRERVRGISYENGSIVVLVGDDKRLPIENVVEVYEGSGSSDPAEEGEGEGEATPDFKTLFPQFRPQPRFQARAQLQPEFQSHVPTSSQSRDFRPFTVIPGGR